MSGEAFEGRLQFGCNVAMRDWTVGLHALFLGSHSAFSLGFGPVHVWLEVWR